MAGFLRWKRSSNDPDSRIALQHPTSDTSHRMAAGAVPTATIFAKFTSGGSGVLSSEKAFDASRVSGPMPLAANGIRRTSPSARRHDFVEKPAAVDWKIDLDPRPPQERQFFVSQPQRKPSFQHSESPHPSAPQPPSRQPSQFARPGSPTKQIAYTPLQKHNAPSLPLADPLDYRKEKPLPVPVPEPSMSRPASPHRGERSLSTKRSNNSLPRDPRVETGAGPPSRRSLRDPNERPISNHPPPLNLDSYRSSPSYSPPPSASPRPFLSSESYAPQPYPLRNPQAVQPIIGQHAFLPTPPQTVAAPVYSFNPQDRRNGTQQPIAPARSLSSSSSYKANPLLSPPPDHDWRPSSPSQTPHRPPSPHGPRPMGAIPPEDQPSAGAQRPLASLASDFVSHDHLEGKTKAVAELPLFPWQTPVANPEAIQSEKELAVMAASRISLEPLSDVASSHRRVAASTGPDTVWESNSRSLQSAPVSRPPPLSNEGTTSLPSYGPHSPRSGLPQTSPPTHRNGWSGGRSPPTSDPRTSQSYLGDPYSPPSSAGPSRSASTRSISQTPVNAPARSKPLIFAAMASVDEYMPGRNDATSPMFPTADPSSSTAARDSRLTLMPYSYPLNSTEQQSAFSANPPLSRKQSAALSFVAESSLPPLQPFSPISPIDFPGQMNDTSPLSPRVLNKLQKARYDTTAEWSDPQPPASTTPAQRRESGLVAPSQTDSYGRSRSRSFTKSRPVTPVANNAAASPPLRPGYPVEAQYDTRWTSGLPLDSDPFARTEGVKVLKSVSPRESGRSSSYGKSSSRNPSLREERMESYQVKQNGSVDPSNTGVRAIAKQFESFNKEMVPSMEPKPVGHKRHSRAKDPNRLWAPVHTLEDCLFQPFVLSRLLLYLSFYEWTNLYSTSKRIRATLGDERDLREEVLERFLATVGYTRWIYFEQEFLVLSLMDLDAYMRAVSTPIHQYARVAESWLQIRHVRSPDPEIKDAVDSLTVSARSYTRVVLRLREQADAQMAQDQRQHRRSSEYVRANAVSSPPRSRSGGPNGGGAPVSYRTPSPTPSLFSHSHHGNTATHRPAPRPSPTVFQSPLYRARRAPVLYVFVPSPGGDWLSDSSVLECEAELKRAGVLKLLRAGDVVWDVAVGDEGNIGRMVWDGSYLIDLDFTYSSIGDVPKYLHALAFPPSYFHRVIRTGTHTSNPVVRIDIGPWGEEIITNLQLLQDRVRTETPQGTQHNVVRWVHRSSFSLKPGSVSRRYSNQNQGRLRGFTERIPIPGGEGLFVDSGWYGTVVVETEGTNEGLADLQERCGLGAFSSRRPAAVRQHQPPDPPSDEGKVFRILRERSRPGEIWIRAVRPKEKLQ